MRFHVKDTLSVLGQAEYSVNGGDWVVVEPTTRLTDSMEHDYRVQVDRGTGEATIAVRVQDEYENQARSQDQRVCRTDDRFSSSVASRLLLQQHSEPCP